ncbi:MAG TPA: NUDIX hydrolase [Candidatus Nanoarchaeia archaeon]|nr:NUDIX hydrolase [Candidatus Nanoarchaeia archaeon]
MKFQGRTATAIIVYPGEKILLIKRSTPPFVNYWALPGGRAEAEETAEQTVVREVKEETGLDVTILRKVGEYHEEGTQGGQEYDYYAACFLVEPVGGEIVRQKNEVEDITLFALDSLPTVMAFVHSQMIKDFLTQETTKESAFS